METHKEIKVVTTEIRSFTKEEIFQILRGAGKLPIGLNPVDIEFDAEKKLLIIYSEEKTEKAFNYSSEQMGLLMTPARQLLNETKISGKLFHALSVNKIDTLYSIAENSREELSQKKNFTIKVLDELQNLFVEHQLTLP